MQITVKEIKYIFLLTWGPNNLELIENNTQKLISNKHQKI